MSCSRFTAQEQCPTRTQDDPWGFESRKSWVVHQVFPYMERRKAKTKHLCPDLIPSDRKDPSLQPWSRFICWLGDKSKPEENYFCKLASPLQTTAYSAASLPCSLLTWKTTLLHCLQYTGTGPAEILMDHIIFDKQ